MFQQPRVRRGKRIGVEFPNGDPTKVLASDGNRLAAGPTAFEEPQVDNLLRIFVGDLGKQNPHRDFDRQFLLKLAAQTGFEGFVELALAAGELPEISQMSGGGSLGDEQPAFMEDQSGSDFDDGLAHGAVDGGIDGNCGLEAGPHVG